MHQGDSLCPTLFGLLVNDLLREENNLKLDITFAKMISTLALADDIVIFEDSENDLQTILKCIENWCKKWRLKVNTEKCSSL